MKQWMTGSHFKVIQCVRYFWLIRICRGEIRHFLLSLFYIMCNIVLNDDLSIRSYFEKVLELVKFGEDFPVNLDEVWPLIYSDKGKAVRVLTGDNGFIKDIDYKVFTQNGKNPTGGRPTIVYMISVSCMEYLIARKERRVFDVYRSVFHGTANALNNTEASVEKNLPYNYIEALEALLASEKEKQALAEAKKVVEEEKKVVQAELNTAIDTIKENEPVIDMFKRSIPREGVLIRESSKYFEQFGYYIGIKNMYPLLQELKYVFRNERGRIEAYQSARNYGLVTYGSDPGDEYWEAKAMTVMITLKGFVKLEEFFRGAFDPRISKIFYSHIIDLW